MPRNRAMPAGDRRIAASLATAAVVVAGCLAIHSASVSRADDPPKAGKPPVSLKSRIRAQHDRFLRLVEPLADMFEELDKVEQASMSQSIRIEGAKAAYENAKLTREVAEIALREYTEGHFPQDLATVEGEQQLAESSLQRVNIGAAERRLERTKEVRKAFEEARPEPALKLFGTLLLDESVARAEAALIVERISLKQAKFAREQADTKHRILHQSTKPRRIRELQSAIEKCRSDEVAKQQTYELEQKRERIIKNELSLARWKPDEKRLLLMLAEVDELNARLPRDPANAKVGGDEPGPTEAEVARTLDAIQAKLDEAERAADELRARRADQEYAATASRVRGLAQRTRKKS